MDLVFVCPACHYPRAQLRDGSNDIVECTDTEYCLWSGSITEAHFVESLV